MSSLSLNHRMPHIETSSHPNSVLPLYASPKSVGSPRPPLCFVGVASSPPLFTPPCTPPAPLCLTTPLIHPISSANTLLAARWICCSSFCFIFILALCAVRLIVASYCMFLSSSLWCNSIAERARSLLSPTQAVGQTTKLRPAA